MTSINNNIEYQGKNVETSEKNESAKYQPAKIFINSKLNNKKKDNSKSELDINLLNLYICPKKYNPDYNFYNYNRFKQTQSIPIIYKTPSIFLNGLHFELPIANIISITKQSDQQAIKLLIQISRQDFQSDVLFDDILDVFGKIEDYNNIFFERYASKMDIKISRTLKNTSYNCHQIPASLAHSAHSAQQTNNITTNRFKPPVSKKLEYKPFYEINNDNIVLTLEIKQQYLFKIIQSQYLTLTSQHITNQSEITESLRQYILQIETLLETLNLEFFEMKKKKIDINLAINPISIRLWIKCNMFSLDTTLNRIFMKWKVCYYEC